MGRVRGRCLDKSAYPLKSAVILACNRSQFHSISTVMPLAQILSNRTFAHSVFCDDGCCLVLQGEGYGDSLPAPVFQAPGPIVWVCAGGNHTLAITKVPFPPPIRLERVFCEDERASIPFYFISL